VLKLLTNLLSILNYNYTQWILDIEQMSLLNDRMKNEEKIAKEVLGREGLNQYFKF
jgi:hypothetical protein